VGLWLVAICTLQGSAQLLLRTNSIADISAISVGTPQSISFGQSTNLEESFYYRQRYDKNGLEKSRYNIFSMYKRGEMLGFCPYGKEIDLMNENFEKSKGNTFRYWNKIRMGMKILVEESAYERATEELWYYLDGEVYLSYLHLPRTARGDQTTRVRKGSFMISVLATPSRRFLGYMKYNVGSTWIKTYYRQENYISYVGIYIEIEINKKGYNRSLVASSRDIYRGITLFGGPEYNLTQSQISLNLGISITTENH
ncbi:hypothetical protein KKH82_08840, partial [Patescibacteria group bacterium]|nr:hypothetical protein [Patescibacteria group bacterium]